MFPKTNLLFSQVAQKHGQVKCTDLALGLGQQKMGSTLYKTDRMIGPFTGKNLGYFRILRSHCELLT